MSFSPKGNPWASFDWSRSLDNTIPDHVFTWVDLACHSSKFWMAKLETEGYDFFNCQQVVPSLAPGSSRVIIFIYFIDWSDFLMYLIKGVTRVKKRP